MNCHETTGTMSITERRLFEAQVFCIGLKTVEGKQAAQSYNYQKFLSKTTNGTINVGHIEVEHYLFVSILRQNRVTICCPQVMDHLPYLQK